MSGEAAALPHCCSDCNVVPPMLKFVSVVFSDDEDTFYDPSSPYEPFGS
jgi:hypothetical protein